MCRRSLRAAVGPASQTMAYQVLARKYRPQRFSDVIGQAGATRTLQNAIASDRLAQAFVFAGPRGVGKTTTARILARALNCAAGPTADPCGSCEPCVEIADGRDIDVLEIDAATHTQVENVREVIIAGLAMAPVRDRYKVFIIDEFHQLSSHSFNALLKSIEEPPPHVVFMMATTELQKIPETILSRSQVFELRTIGMQAIAEQLRTTAGREQIAIDEAGVALIARAADGSMRDALSALDQVIAFAGERITAEEVSTVLGLIGREPVLDAVELVANEDAAAVFELAGRFVEAGYDLRLVCRELTRALRDMLVVAIDPGRAQDPEIAGDAERERLVALSGRFSREDLMRAFDVLSQAELDIRGAAQPRHHFEMALLKWMHLRQLVPLTELLAGGAARAGAPSRSAAAAPARPGTAPSGAAPSGARAPRAAARPRPPAAAPRAARPSAEQLPPAASARPAPSAAPPPAPSAQPAAPAGSSPAGPSPTASAQPPPAPAASARPAAAAADAAAEADPKAAILAEIKRAKRFFYGTVVAQAQSIDLAGDRLVFKFTAGQRTLAAQVAQGRGWLEGLASKAAGRKVTVAAEQTDAPPEPAAAAPGPAPAPSPAESQRELKMAALDDEVVQALLEVFPAEIRDIEKIDP